jgi:hypothetical protein
MTRARLVLVLATVAVLAGCAGDPGRPPPSSPTRTLPPPTLSPATTLVSALPRKIGTEGRYQVYEVSPQQYELIGRRVHEVLVRQGLWDQGVRFGANYDPAKDLHFVLIDPGLSRLSARQILDRLLGTI